jgi:hypothetical protein
MGFHLVAVVFQQDNTQIECKVLLEMADSEA